MKEIPLSRGLVALVDDADYASVMAAGPWHAYPGHLTLYARHSISATRQITLHSFLTGWPITDHQNGNGLDNRRSNLRAATTSQNNANARVRRDNTSGYKGVAYIPKSGKWRAYIGNPQRHLGHHDTAEQAAHAYDVAAVARFGEFAILNLPLEQTA